VPHEVTDDEHDRAVRQRNRVEPVTARLVLPGDQVARGDPGPRQHWQRGGQQRFLQLGGEPASRLAARFSLGRLLLRYPPLEHLQGHVGPGHEHAGDRSVGCPQRRGREVAVDLLDPFAAVVDLRPPGPARLRLAGSVHPVEQLQDLLPSDLGKGLAQRHADEAGAAEHRPAGRVHRGDPVLRARHREHRSGHLLEGIPHGIRRAHLPGERVVVGGPGQRGPS